jgi:hypothetical protein
MFLWLHLGGVMFHFIVKGAGWTSDRDTIDRSRVLEYTEEHIKDLYAPGSILDLEKTTEIPALFVSETGGLGEEIGRIGTITRVRVVGRNYQIDYTLDPDIPGIPNAKLEELAGDLEIVDFEFQRTHWAIKEVDLFKVLLKHGAGQRPKPKVFQLPDQIDDDLVSVMMPFDAAFNDVYETLKDAAHEIGMRCQRADDIWETDTVIQDVANLIGRARVVVCDLTGRNSNVFYETGIAHTLGRDVVLITQSAGDVPFDVGHIRYLRYLNNGEGRSRLQQEVLRRLHTLTGRD